MNETKTETWYRVASGCINEVKVVKFSDKTITTLQNSGRTSRQNRNSSYEKFFRTRAEAVSHLIKKAEQRLEFAQYELEDANKYLDEMRKLV